MIVRRKGRAAVTAVAATVLIGLVALQMAEARKKRGGIELSQLPGWVREAAAREVDPEDADLVWLHDEETVEPLTEGGVRVVHRLAGKALKPSALDDLGSFWLEYARGDRIEQLSAWTIRADGSVLRADPKDDVADLPRVKDGGYDDYRVRVIEAPGEEVGAIVAFEGVRVKQLDVGAESFLFGSAVRPTAFSRFELKAPEGWTWERVALRDDDLEVESGDTSVVTTARNLKRLPIEHLRPPSGEILPLVWVRWWSPDGTRGYKTWKAMGAWYRELTAAVFDNLGEAAQLGSKHKPEQPEQLLSSLETVFEFAARKVRYVSIDVGIGTGAGYEPAAPAAVCSNRYGDCKDKAFLLRGIAREWGVQTFPVLVRTADRGPVLPEVPTPAQFNHCIAAVKLPDGVGDHLWSTAEVEGIGRVVFLDATVRDGGPWDLRYDAQGTLAALVHADGVALVDLPVQPPDRALTRREVEAEIAADGNLVRATLAERWTGTSATRIRSHYSGMSEEKHRAEVLEDLQDRFPGARVSEYEIEGLDDVHADVVERTTLDAGRVGKSVGNLLIVEPGKFGYGILGRTLGRPPRRWPLRVGLPRTEEVEVSLRLPEGLGPEELPPPFNLESDEVTAEAEWSHENGTLVYRRTVSLLRREVSPDRYPEFRENLNEIRAADRQSVVLVRE